MRSEKVKKLRYYSLQEDNILRSFHLQAKPPVDCKIPIDPWKRQMFFEPSSGY